MPFHRDVHNVIFVIDVIIGQVYEIVANNKIDNKVAITYNNKL